MKAAFPLHGHPLTTDDLHNLFRKGRIVAALILEAIAIAAIAILLFMAARELMAANVSGPPTGVLTTQAVPEPTGVSGRAFWVGPLGEAATRAPSRTPVLSLDR